jgi:hypothetical protein
MFFVQKLRTKSNLFGYILSMWDLIRVAAIATLFAVSSLAGGAVFQSPGGAKSSPGPPAFWTR